jgi:hypothetical protein
MEARNAGKTGYQGLGARATNPNGDYANVYYDPQKAAEYYQANKKTTSGGGSSIGIPDVKGSKSAGAG